MIIEKFFLNLHRRDYCPATLKMNSEFIDLDGQRLHYTLQGSGRPLIMMHGWGCTHETVASMAAVAAETHTVYSVDFPGFGRSPEPAEV